MPRGRPIPISALPPVDPNGLAPGDNDTTGKKRGFGTSEAGADGRQDDGCGADDDGGRQGGGKRPRLVAATGRGDTEQDGGHGGSLPTDAPHMDVVVSTDGEL